MLKTEVRIPAELVDSMQNAHRQLNCMTKVMSIKMLSSVLFMPSYFCTFYVKILYYAFLFSMLYIFIEILYVNVQFHFAQPISLDRRNNLYASRFVLPTENATETSCSTFTRKLLLLNLEFWAIETK